MYLLLPQAPVEIGRIAVAGRNTVKLGHGPRSWLPSAT
jgi:hypothetical protein